MSLDNTTDSARRFDEDDSSFTPYFTQPWTELLAAQQQPRSQATEDVTKLPQLDFVATEAPPGQPAAKNEVDPAQAGDRHNDPILTKLSESSEEKEQKAAESVRSLLASTDPADQKDGKQLLAMLKDEKQRALALAVLDKMTDPEARRSFLELLTNPDMAKAAGILAQMLKQPDDSGSPYAVQALMQMLKGDDKESKQDAQLLLKMLNNPAEAETGKLLLEKFGGPFGAGGDLHQMLTMLDDPKQRDAAKTILDLVKSDKDGDYWAGRNLLHLLSSNELDATDKKTLMTMLGDGRQRTSATAILSALTDPAEIHEMLKINGNPAMKRATSTLLEMMSGDESSKQSASELMRALSSKVEPDKKDGERLLKMLNSETPGDRENAQKVLRLVSNMDERTKVLDLLEKPESKKGVERLFDILDRTGRRNREPGETLLSLLVSNNPAERRSAERLVGLLGGDKDQQTTAELLIRKLTPQQIEPMLDLLDKNKDAAKLLLSWIGGEDMDKRVAAKALLDLKADKQGQSAADKLAVMLADPKQVDQARAILSLDNPAHISKLMELRERKDLQNGVEKLVSMLGSKNESDKRAARNLMETLAGGRLSNPFFDGQNIESQFAPRTDTKTGERLLKMLGDPAQADTARTILTHLEKAADQAKIVALLDTDKNTANRLLKLISGSEGHIGLGVLSNFTEPKHINKLLDLLESPEHRSAASRLTSMLESGGALSLVKLLTSNEESEKKLGEALLKDLDESRSFNPPTADILNAGLTPKEAEILMKLLDNRDNFQATRTLIAAINNPAQANGAKSLLALLGSDDPAARKAGERLLERFNDLKQQDTASTILEKVSDVASLRKLSDMLDSEKEKPAAQELLKLMSGSEGNQEAARNLLFMLTSRRSGTAETVLALLTSKDAKDQQLGKNMIESLGDPGRLAKFVELTDKAQAKTPEQKAVAERLLAMMSSTDAAQRRGVDSLMSLLSNGGPDEKIGRKLLEMLGKENTQKDAEAILSLLTKPEHLQGLMNLMTSEKHAGAAKVLVEMLRSGDAAQARSATALLDALRPDNGLRPVSRMGQAEPETAIVALLDKLSNPKTAAVAKQALMMADSKDGVLLPARMLETPGGEKNLQRLMEMLKNEEQKGIAQTILGSRLLRPDSVDQLLKLVDDPKQKESVAVLLGMLNDDDLGKAFAASRLLDMMASQDENQKKAAAKILDMLGDSEKRDLAETMMLRVRPTLLPQLVNIAADKQLAMATGNIVELLKSEDFEDVEAANRLLTMLGSSDAGERKLGEQFLAMMNSDRHHYTAIRMIKARFPRSRFIEG